MGNHEAKTPYPLRVEDRVARLERQIETLLQELAIIKKYVFVQLAVEETRKAVSK